MDASLEIPTDSRATREDEGASSGEEEAGLDWTKIPSAIARPVIPKRGEKEFEPAGTGGSGLQAHNLGRARSAMFDALSATRTISSKSISYGVWYPDIARVHVTQARGIHFGSMGHSFPREVSTTQSLQKRLELLPEEALYLVERGALQCYKDNKVALAEVLADEDVQHCPMSVQQAFSEMIGREGLTLEHYQVFSYLKRLGYALIRAQPPSPHYPMPASPLPLRDDAAPLANRFASMFVRFLTSFIRVFTPKLDWWRPIRLHRWLYHDKNYASVFKSLRFLRASLHKPIPSATSPYHIFFHVYKPSTPFRKTSPPPPDFSIAVVNARETTMPSFAELATLFESLPETSPILRRPPPPPRHSQPSDAEAETKPLLHRFWQFICVWWFPKTKALAIDSRKPNAFSSMKAGKKAAIIAAVDSGVISFFRFGQGVFCEWPMV